LDKKSKLIENLNTEKISLTQSQQRMQVQSQISANQKKKEREMEQRLKDQEGLVAEQKRQLARY
jgi:hypothetical protein